MQQVSSQETALLLSLLESALAVPGDVVEFGCYRGDTSTLFQKLLARSAPEKSLWLYDSFQGLPAKSPEDASAAGDQFRPGELLVTKKEVVTKFKKSGLPLPRIKKAFFEELDPSADLPAKIAFAFLDGDLYQSIKTSLRLVVPRLSPGAIVVVHDYHNPELPGVTRAVDEFISASRRQSSQSSRSSQSFLSPSSPPPSSSSALSPPPSPPSSVPSLQRRESLAILHFAS